MRNNSLRRKRHAGEPVYGAWVTLESANVTEACVASGVDWVVIEMEHGHLDWRDVANHVRATAGTDTAALIRIPDTQRSFVQRALDIGADGVICPMIGSREELEAAFQFGRFPPRGVRGVGGERSVKWGLEWDSYLKNANVNTWIIPLLETRAAVDNIDSILDVDGLELIFFGPADLSASFGFLGQWEGPGVAEAILAMRAKAVSRGISTGILARSSDEAMMRREQGFQMIGLGADVNLMLRSLQHSLDLLR